MNKEILCSISTRGRYNTTLAMALSAIINQTRKPDKLVLFDDNDEPKDLREDTTYLNLFKMMEIKGIKWECIFGQKKGQHYNHQIANKMGYEWVWRVDDDNIPEPDVLEKLMSHAKPGIGAVGGSILVPTDCHDETSVSGNILKIDDEPNIQWSKITEEKYVDHLHCSFIYRAGIHDYNLGLSRVAHREETLFTYGLKLKGYQNLVIPDCITWHLKCQTGGIRTEKEQLFIDDEKIFRNIINLKDSTIVVLNSGMGDHIVFKHVLPEIKNPLIFSCYPDIVPGRSIAEAIEILGDIESYNIYAKMDEWKWKDSLENAFRKMYVK